MALRDLCLVILGLVLFVAGIFFVLYLAISSVKEPIKEPRSLAKYEPQPWYPGKVKGNEDWAQVRERKDFEILY